MEKQELYDMCKSIIELNKKRYIIIKDEIENIITNNISNNIQIERKLDEMLDILLFYETKDNKMIRNIIFDLGNVIINYNQEQIINNFTKKEEEIKYIYDEIFHAPEWELMDLGNITNDEATEVINKRNKFKYQKLTDNFLHEWYKKQEINRDIVEIVSSNVSTKNKRKAKLSLYQNIKT